MKAADLRDYDKVAEAVKASGGFFIIDEQNVPFVLRVSEVTYTASDKNSKPIFAVLDAESLEEVARIAPNSVIRIKVRGMRQDPHVTYLFGFYATAMPDGCIEIGLGLQRTAAFPGYWVGFVSSDNGKKLEMLLPSKTYNCSDEAKGPPFLAWCPSRLHLQTIKDKIQLPLAELTASVNAHYADRGLCSDYPLWSRGKETFLCISLISKMYVPYYGHWIPPEHTSRFPFSSYLVTLAPSDIRMGFPPPSPIELLAFPNSPWTAVEPWLWTPE